MQHQRKRTIADIKRYKRACRLENHQAERSLKSLARASQRHGLGYVPPGTNILGSRVLMASKTQPAVGIRYW